MSSFYIISLFWPQYHLPHEGEGGGREQSGMADSLASGGDSRGRKANASWTDS